MRNIAFIGMMGTGKTVTSRKVAEKLGMNFMDIDECLVARLGMTISVAFITFGEKTFRGYEHDVMCEVVWQDNFVISCGGGAPLYKPNMDLIENFIKVRLTASPEEIYRRTKDDFSRPLLKNNSPQKIAEMIAEREEVYNKYADITVCTDDKTVDEVVEEVLSELKKFI